MNNLTKICLISSSLLLTACSSRPLTVTSPAPDFSGSHIEGAEQKKSIASDIQSVFPEPSASLPTSVILLNNTFSVKNLGKASKNKAICEGWNKLQVGSRDEIAVGATSKVVLNYMLVNPAIMSNERNQYRALTNCDYLLKNYNYVEADKELNKIFKNSSAPHSPYIVVYEPKYSPNSSMVLALGNLSDNEIKVIAKNWEGLLLAAYKDGDAVDPYLGIAALIEGNEEISQASQEDILEKITIGTSTIECASALAGSTISLASLIKIPSCKAAYLAAKKKFFG